jgi:hypothetical protein
VEESVLEQWVVEDLSGKPGASILYSDLAIQTMATVKAVYRLTGRQCQRFLESIFELMEIDLPVPDHSTHGNRKDKPHQHDENLRSIRKHGRKRWKRDSGYHRRSIAETGACHLCKLLHSPSSPNPFSQAWEKGGKISKSLSQTWERDLG